MRKALAQNPNLLRTLIGLSLTLVFVLSYAVYSATMDSEYYVYKTDREERPAHLSLMMIQHYSEDGVEYTSWIWSVDLERQNLTWINTSLIGAKSDTTLSVSNSEGWYSHVNLGNSDAERFNCAEDCKKKNSHSMTGKKGDDIELIGLSHPESGRRDGGTVRAKDLSKAEVSAREIINNSNSGVWQISVISQGNHTTAPPIVMLHVNEEFASIEEFSVDAATELMWSLAAVTGCFIITLVPIMTIFIFTRLREKDSISTSEGDGSSYIDIEDADESE